MPKSTMFASAGLILVCLVLSRYSEAHDRSGCFPADIERQAGTNYAALRAISYRANSNYPTTYLIKIRAVHVDGRWSYLHIEVFSGASENNELPLELVKLIVDREKHDKLEVEDFI